MIFQGKIDRIFKKLHDEKKEEEKQEELKGRENATLSDEMEKGDFAAMVISALITIVPVAFLALLALVGIGYFFFFH